MGKWYWFEEQRKNAAGDLIANAQRSGLDATSFMKQAAKQGLLDLENVQAFAKTLQAEKSRKDAASKQDWINQSVTAARSSSQVQVPEMNLEQAPVEQPPEFSLGEDLSQTGKPMLDMPQVTPPTSYKTVGRGAPEDYKQFQGNLSQEMQNRPMPEGATDEDVENNPLYAATKAMFGQPKDEMAQARLDLQRQREERLAISRKETNDLMSNRDQIARERLELDKVIAGISKGSMPAEADADAWRNKAADASEQSVKIKAKLKANEGILKDLVDKGNNSEYALTYDLPTIKTQIAILTSTKDQLDSLSSDWNKTAKDIETKGAKRAADISRVKKPEVPEIIPKAAPTDSVADVIKLKRFGSPRDPGFAQLPPGSKFLDANGVTRIKK